MSKSNVKKLNTENNSFNIDIEALVGTRITINGEESKHLTVYENDTEFVEDLMAYGDFLKEAKDKYERLSNEVDEISDDDTEEEQIDKINKTLKVTKEVLEDAKVRFNKIFKDDTAFDRIFDNVKSLEAVVSVIERVTNFVYNRRKDSINSTAKYTNKYKK